MKNNLINVILYCRVSTDDQALGFSLVNQKDTLNRYCQSKNYNILDNYMEDESAKTFDRPEWMKMEKYVKTNRKQVDKVLFVKWDRFSRNNTEAHAKVDLFHLTYGVELNACEQPLDLSIPENLLMLSNYLAMSDIERRRISQRTLDGNYTAKKEGYYPHKACFGYKNFKIKYPGKKKGRGTLQIVEEQAKLVREAFQEVAKGLEPIDAIRKKLNNKGLTMGSSNFQEMLSKVVYIGKVIVPEYKGENAYLNDAIHDAMIDEKTFYKVQDIKYGRKTHHLKPTHKNINFPLRQHLICDECGNMLTGSPSKGRTKYYHYYHCRDGCKLRVGKNKVATMFNSILEDISINENVLSAYKQTIKKTIKEKESSKEKDINKKLKEKAEIISRIEKTEDNLSNNDISPDTFNRMNSRYQKDLQNINHQIEVMNENNDSLINKVDGALQVLLDIPIIYKNAEHEQKQLIIGSMFPNKLILSKNNCRTNGNNKVIELISRNSKDSGSQKKRKAVKNDSFSALVPGAGLEPARPQWSQDFKSCVSTNSTTRATFNKLNTI